MGSLGIDLGDRSYKIRVGSGLLEDLGATLKDHPSFRGRTLLVVSQKQILAYYKNIVSESLSKQGFEVAFFVTPFSRSSEASKTEQVWSKLIRALSQLDGKNRSLALVALGGGVIGDLTGFAAAVYRRGIPYAQIPTTLTAQVDSAIGGKTGIDLPQGKNLLGVIYQPSLVVCDLSVLSSLPERHMSDGFAEVIKYGVIRDPRLFSLLEKESLDTLKGNLKMLSEVIRRCIQIKKEVVEKDELDKKGIRILLNFGHTAGHAIEAVTGYSQRYTHGEAVGIGMLVACDISMQLGLLKNRSLTDRLEKTLIKYRLPLQYRGLAVDQLLDAMGYDKKSEQKKNRFVLPVDIGKTVLQTDIPPQVIREALLKRKA